MGGWEGGGLQLPNNLLKFVDFVSEKDCESQGRRNEDSSSYIFEEATRIYQNCNLLMSYKSKISKFSWEESHWS